MRFRLVTAVACARIGGKPTRMRVTDLPGSALVRLIDSGVLVRSGRGLVSRGPRFDELMTLWGGEDMLECADARRIPSEPGPCAANLAILLALRLLGPSSCEAVRTRLTGSRLNDPRQISSRLGALSRRGTPMVELTDGQWSATEAGRDWTRGIAKASVVADGRVGLDYETALWRLTGV